MLCSGEDAQEPYEYQLEAVLRVLQREIRHGRLFADNELQFRNQIYH